MGNFEDALNADSYASSRPLYAIIDTNSEVEESFDDISYNKGGAVITMTVNMIGNQRFRKALNVGYILYRS